MNFQIVRLNCLFNAYSKMQNISRIMFLFLLFSIQLFSQTNQDTSKSFSKNNNEKTRLDTNSKTLKSLQNRFELQKDITSVPLNLKIFQQILIDEMHAGRKLSSEELATGMSDAELTAFDINKNNFEKMLYATYGEDIINMKKILEKLGITKSEVVLLAAILKFLFYAPML